MEISGSVDDFRAKLLFTVLAVTAQVFLLFVLSWNIVVIITCISLSIFLLIELFVDWLYFSRKVILDACGCTFVLGRATKNFKWEEIHLQYTDNKSFLFGDSEIPGEGVILSTKPISKPVNIGAMTYCRFTNPSTSVFIRFTAPFDKFRISYAKFVFRGFVADKNEVLSFLMTGDGLRKTGDSSLS